MYYTVTYQALRKGAGRPSDGDEERFDFGQVKTEVQFLPNVGDFVHIDRSSLGAGQKPISGRVRSRLFTYPVTPVGTSCFINIVVEETDDDWSMLIKE